MLLATMGSVLEIIIRIVAGFTGDKLYKKAVVQGVKKVKESDDVTEPVELALARKGGINPLMGIVGIFAIDFILEWIGALYILM